jgi:mRNA-degrading endonuclease RelE of RelBE toxin-antitoxin system
MRTTLTIDDDVATQLERLRRKNDVGFKELVNDVLRRGLREINAPRKKRKPFRTKPHDGGYCLLTNLDNIEEVISLLEGDLHK